MRRWRKYFCYITLGVICQVVIGMMVASCEVVRAEEGSDTDKKTPTLTTAQETAIKEHCDMIREALRTVQHDDSRMRVNLGRYYETILSDYITALNVGLVANNLSDVGLIENQSKFAAVRGVFIQDYIEYQKSLEDLVGMNCVAEPKKFYEKLVGVREKRKVVADDTVKLRWLMGKQVEMVTKLKEKL